MCAGLSCCGRSSPDVAGRRAGAAGRPRAPRATAVADARPRLTGAHPCGAGRDVLDAARPARPLAEGRRDARPEGRRGRRARRARVRLPQRRAGRARAAVPRARAQVARAGGRARSGWSRSTSAAPATTRCAARRCRRQMGASDLTPPTRRRGRRTARRRSATQRGFYTTADTVDDLEALRIALGADKLRSTGSPTARSSPSATRSRTRTASAGSCSTRSCPPRA